MFGLGCASFIGARWGSVKEEPDREYSPLVRGCWIRFNLNTRYKPTIEEVKFWLDTIRQYDKVVKDQLFYAGILDLESLGDASSYPRGNLDGRGVAGIKVGTARYLNEKYNLGVSACGSMLFNPAWAIRVMVLYIEDLIGKAPAGVDIQAWSLANYSQGEGAFKKKWKGGRIDTVYTREHAHRVRLIKQEMKGVGR